MISGFLCCVCLFIYFCSGLRALYTLDSLFLSFSSRFLLSYKHTHRSRFSSNRNSKLRKRRNWRGREICRKKNTEGIVVSPCRCRRLRRPPLLRLIIMQTYDTKKPSNSAQMLAKKEEEEEEKRTKNPEKY